jgi:hypothetical protein
MEVLESRGMMTLAELAAHFRMEPAALEPLLGMLVSRGRIRVLGADCGRGPCSGCSCTERENMVFYESTGCSG